MRWIKSGSLAVVIAAALAGLAPARADAGQVLNFTLKGSSISGNFGTTQTIPCGTGHSTIFTFVSWTGFQAQQRQQGTLTTFVWAQVGCPALAETTFVSAGAFIMQNNNCTGATFEDFAFVQSGVTLTVDGTKSATLTGDIPLFVSGGTLSLNVTVSQTIDTTNGLRFNRSNVGPMIFKMRTVSSSADATAVSGTVALNGQNIPLVNLSDVSGSIQNNNTGTLLVIGARTSP